jgi:hypothetical protein
LTQNVSKPSKGACSRRSLFLCAPGRGHVLGSESPLRALIGGTVSRTARVSSTPTPADGATLYAVYCASCYEPLATSTKRGATASIIQAGISGNSGGMRHREGLNFSERDSCHSRQYNSFIKTFEDLAFRSLFLMRRIV